MTVQPATIPSAQSMVDAMISLARLPKTRRMIVAGSMSFGLYLGLLKRGYPRVTTRVAGFFARGQHDVALIAGRHSFQALEMLMMRVVPLLNARATIVVWVDSHAEHRGGQLQEALERLGFRIEAGTKCQDGFILSAQRREWSPIAMARAA